MSNLVVKSKKDVWNAKFPTKLVFFGVAYKIQLETNKTKNSLDITGKTALLRTKENTTEQQKIKLITERYRHQLKEEIDIVLPKLEKMTNLHCSTYGTKIMSTRWGTCNTKSKKIWLNVQLAQMPKKCLEYVILHELIHTKISRHTNEFRALLEQYMPDWKKYQLLLEK